MGALHGNCQQQPKHTPSAILCTVSVEVGVWQVTNQSLAAKCGDFASARLILMQYGVIKTWRCASFRSLTSLIFWATVFLDVSFYGHGDYRALEGLKWGPESTVALSDHSLRGFHWMGHYHWSFAPSHVACLYDGVSSRRCCTISWLCINFDSYIQLPGDAQHKVPATKILLPINYPKTTELVPPNQWLSLQLLRSRHRVCKMWT